MHKPIKRDANLIFNSLSACLPMKGIYTEFSLFIDDIITKIYEFKFSSDLKEDIKKFLLISLKQDETNKNFFIEGEKEIVGYTILLSVLGISREKFKNLIFPNHSFFKTSLSNVLKNEYYLDNLAKLLIFGDKNEELNSILNGDLLTLNRFCLHRYKCLYDLFSNKFFVRRFLEDTYCSRLENKKGYFVEKNILGKEVEALGLQYEAGCVPCLEKYFQRTSPSGDSKSRNPRIDLVIPSLNNPKILIESTYNLTTASGQTKKADANDDLYRAICKYNEENEEKIIFINFIDGGGWKTRGLADVSRFISSCDYAINYNNLDLLTDVLKYYFKMS